MDTDSRPYPDPEAVVRVAYRTGGKGRKPMYHVEIDAGLPPQTQLKGEKEMD